MSIFTKQFADPTQANDNAAQGGRARLLVPPQPATTHVNYRMYEDLIGAPATPMTPRLERLLAAAAADIEAGTDDADVGGAD